MIKIYFRRRRYQFCSLKVFSPHAQGEDNSGSFFWLWISASVLWLGAGVWLDQCLVVPRGYHGNTYFQLCLALLCVYAPCSFKSLFRIKVLSWRTRSRFLRYTDHAKGMFPELWTPALRYIHIHSGSDSDCSWTAV